MTTVLAIAIPVAICTTIAWLMTRHVRRQLADITIQAAATRQALGDTEETA